MTIIVGEGTTANGKIGYKNLFETSGVTVTASTETTDFEKENAYDGFGYDFWKPTATGDSWIRASFSGTKVANYMAVWGHDLSDHGSSVKPQYSTNGGSSWSDAESAVMPSNNNTVFITWDDITGADWRCLVTNPTTLASIAGVQIGEVLEFTHGMPEGFMPPSMAPEVTLKTARSETGVFIGGRKLSEGIKGNISLDVIDPVWVRSTWEPFIAHVQTPKPFVFSWDNTNHPTEVVLCWATKKMSSPSYSSSLYMRIGLDFEGTL